MPKNRPPRGILSFQEEAFNWKLCLDRIIVDFFECICSLWGVVRRKY